jgi:predicted transport protein
MALFRLAGGAATQVRPIAQSKERDVQKVIEANLEPIFGALFIRSEFSTGQKHRGRIDTLGLDQDGSPVIIEYKLNTNENVINQGLFYLDWLMDHRGDFEVAARDALGNVEIVWSSPRLILLASGFSRYDQYAVNRIDERIELWTYTFYEGDLLGVDLLSSEEVASTKTKSASSKMAAKVKPAKVASEFDLDFHFAKLSDATRPVFDLLRDNILALGDDVTERYMKQYVGYRRLKNFCEIVGLRNKLNVFIDGPIHDPDGIGEDVSGIGHWGTGNVRVTVASDDDVKRVMPLIEQAYKLQA